ncbi:hypothetical protein D3C77_804180 [compost metagenome]
MLADNNRRRINIEQQIAVIFERKMLQRVLLDGQIDRGVGNSLVINKQHDSSSIQIYIYNL